MKKSVILVVILILIAVLYIFLSKTSILKLTADVNQNGASIITPAPLASESPNIYQSSYLPFKFSYPAHVNGCSNTISLSDPWVLNKTVYGIDVFCTKDTNVVQFIGEKSNKDIINWWYSLLPENKSFYQSYGSMENITFAGQAAKKISYRKKGIDPKDDHYDQTEIIFKKGAFNYLVVSLHSLCSDCWEGKVGDQIASTFAFTDIITPTPFSTENVFCGGIAGIACPDGFKCQLDGNYPDAGGKCVIKQ